MIIPTLACEERGQMLRRAIASVVEESRVPVETVVVVNGNRWNADLVNEIRKLPHVRLVQVELGSLPNAISVGRRLVSAPYFSFLDDDDEYLPGAVDSRVGVLQGNPEIDVVVTNGYRNVGGVDEPAFAGAPDLQPDPLLALFRRNWLPSCGGTFRTATVTADLFDQVAGGLEWTWLAYSIAVAGRTVHAIDEFTFRIHDTPLSESKSDAYLLNQVACFQRMLAKSPRADITSLLRRELAHVFHDVSDFHLRRGNRRLAWRNHLASLGTWYGLRFLPYSRHLLKM